MNISIKLCYCFLLKNTHVLRAAGYRKKRQPGLRFVNRRLSKEEVKYEKVKMTVLLIRRQAVTLSLWNPSRIQKIDFKIFSFHVRIVCFTALKVKVFFQSDFSFRLFCLYYIHRLLSGYYGQVNFLLILYLLIFNTKWLIILQLVNGSLYKQI